MIEPTQLLEMTIYSKIIGEISGKITSDIRIVIAISIVYFLYKHIPETYYTKFLSYINNKTESFIVIPSHKKTYHISGYTSKEVTKLKYSHRFKALHYYLLHTCKVKFTQLYEIMEIADNCKEYSHTELEEYILMPYQNNKVQICPKLNIYLEISVSVESNDDKDDKAKKSSQSYKQYLCKISTPGTNTSVLHEFLENCIEEHNTYLKKNTSKQYIFEYSKTEYDDNDRKVAKYVETPFVSNKHLTKNIFFPEKEQFMKQLDKFVHNRKTHQAEYEESGQTFKLTMVLHGTPGTGKTCIVRGMLNYTGRDAILVPWSRIKTCGELSSILRTNQFNGKTKELKDLIFIFEDFDANYNKALKARKTASVKKIYKSDDSDSDSDSPVDITVLTNKLSETANTVNTPNEIIEQIKSLKEYATKSMNMVNKPIEDELTLEYVLNMFDGIVEMHDAIIVFTTNHLEEIDPAAIRPGRVDYILELKNATIETIKEMIKHKFKLTEEEMLKYEEYLSKIKDINITPAKVQNECFKYSEAEEVLSALCK
jgi:hypothetical protein